jgi:hypothetical protein
MPTENKPDIRFIPAYTLHYTGPFVFYKKCNLLHEYAGITVDVLSESQTFQNHWRPIGLPLCKHIVYN